MMNVSGSPWTPKAAKVVKPRVGFAPMPMIAEEQSRDPQGGDEAAEDPVSEEEEVKTLPRVDGGQASDAAARADETMRTDLRRPIEGEVSEEKRLKSDDAMLSELMGSQAAASSGQSGGAQMVTVSA